MRSIQFNRRAFLRLMGCGTAAAALPRLGSAAQAAGRRPNIVLIMSDDMGYSDIGCYGSEISTPNLDALAANGLRFTQFYNAARCCPTRASLTTGLYPHQAGIGGMVNDAGAPGYRGRLNDRCVTIAEVLKAAGYATYMAGKWHVVPFPTRQTVALASPPGWPRQRGFDRFYGTIRGAGSFWDPGSLARDDGLISPFADPEYKPAQYYYTDAISDQAVRFVREHEGEQPFFMYVAYTAAHWPMHAPERDIAKYKGKYDTGYRPIREARYRRMKELGVIQADWPISEQVGDWDKMPHKAWEARCMEVYAAMIDNMDRGIGRIAAELKRRGKLDNTLIFYLQDNGGCHESKGRKPRGKHTTRPDAPPYDPTPSDKPQLSGTPNRTRDGYPVVMGPGIMPGPADTYTAYGRSWANVSNTPFRMFKHWVHEGGISTPLIAHWPAGIQARGELRHQLSHIIDIMHTCVDVAGARYPTEHNGKPIQPMEGISLVPAFAGRNIPRGPLVWEHMRNRAIRVENWKLVSKTAGNRQPGAWELYDMAADRSELNDLAQQHPERVKELAALWEQHARRTQVLPYPGKKKKRTIQK